jgi:S-adenosylmethionine-diacylgycerolhomoserine-N-methlytransferase
VSGTVDNAAHRMDQIYRRQRLIYDITRKYYLVGRDQLIRQLAPPPGSVVLEVGCGTGRNLIQAARHYPGARFFGIDISTEMLTSAAAAIARTKLSSRIAIAQADATTFDPVLLFGWANCERIFISYTLSMIPRWQQVLSRCVQCLPVGGSLHLVDFGQQERLPRWFKLLLFDWLGQFEVRPHQDLRGELEGLAAVRNMQLDFSALLRGYAWYAVLTRTFPPQAHLFHPEAS